MENDSVSNQLNLMPNSPDLLHYLRILFQLLRRSKDSAMQISLRPLWRRLLDSRRRSKSAAENVMCVALKVIWISRETNSQTFNLA